MSEPRVTNQEQQCSSACLRCAERRPSRFLSVFPCACVIRHLTAHLLGAELLNAQCLVLYIEYMSISIFIAAIARSSDGSECDDLVEVRVSTLHLAVIPTFSTSGICSAVCAKNRHGADGIWAGRCLLCDVIMICDPTYSLFVSIRPVRFPSFWQYEQDLTSANDRAHDLSRYASFFGEASYSVVLDGVGLSRDKIRLQLAPCGPRQFLICWKLIDVLPHHAHKLLVYL